LLKKLAGVRELSMNQLAQEAIDRYSEDEDMKVLIDRHRQED
jgi:hypothetical protein